MPSADGLSSLTSALAASMTWNWSGEPFAASGKISTNGLESRFVFVRRESTVFEKSQVVNLWVLLLVCALRTCKTKDEHDRCIWPLTRAESYLKSISNTTECLRN